MAAYGLLASSYEPLRNTHLCQVGDLHMPLRFDDLPTIRLQPTHHYLQLRCLASTIHTWHSRQQQQ